MSTTKERLIAAGAKLFLVHSYQGTGINDILKACDVPKGSFYNYFPSKEDFALAVVDYHMEQTGEFVQSNLCNEKLSPLQRLAAYLDSIAQGMVDCNFAMGCAFGTMAQEMSGLSPKLREALKRAFQAQVDHIVRCLRQGQQRGEIKPELDPESTAGVVMSALQGAQIIAKTFLSGQPLHDVRNMVIDVFLPSSRS